MDTNRSAGIALSVIIPTRNHAQLVSDLLNTLAAQESAAFPWEVLVIDNGSTDQTAHMTKQKCQALPIDIRYIYEGRPGLHNGRHRGALEARGKFLAYLDDDVLVTPAWIRGVERLSKGQADAVMGRVLPKWEVRPPGWLKALSREPGFLSLLDMGAGGFYIDPRFVYGDNFFIAAKTVFKLGGFHPDGMPANLLRFRGDGEYGLMLKFKAAGMRAWYEPLATVYHRIPRERMSVDYLCRRSYAQGISDSFTEIRARQNSCALGLKDSIEKTAAARRSLRFHAQRIMKMSLPKIICNIKSRIGIYLPPTRYYINERLRNSLAAGYQYHQAEVLKDALLLKWVQQKDYWGPTSDIVIDNA
jgi:glucosyl-dolichyl phosphate glucuronosyltransferase